MCCSTVLEYKSFFKISPTELRELSKARSKILLAKSLNSSFFATKSVSQVNDKIDALSSEEFNL